MKYKLIILLCAVVSMVVYWSLIGNHKRSFADVVGVKSEKVSREVKGLSLVETYIFNVSGVNNFDINNVINYSKFDYLGKCKDQVYVGKDGDTYNIFCSGGSVLIKYDVDKGTLTIVGRK